MQINFFPINIGFDKYQIYSEEYTDERIIELRKKYNSTHSFFRSDGLIYISNKDGDQNIPIGTLVERSVIEDNKVTSSLIKHIFFRTFKDRFADYTPVDFYPFRFFSKKTKDDIIHDILPGDLRDRIAYKKMIEIHLRLMKCNGINQFGFVINIKRNWIFSKNCEELKLEGYDLRGSIKRLSMDQGWEDGDTVRLIFHIFKPVKNTEFDVISQLIKETPEYNIKFAFVMIGKSHPFLLFDQNQKGIVVDFV